jgi:transposase
VATVTIYTWIKSLSSIKVSKDEAIIAKEYQAMKKRIAQLEMENEILKKATAIFAKKQ